MEQAVNNIKINDNVIYTGKSDRDWTGIVLGIDTDSGLVAVRWTSVVPEGRKALVRHQFTRADEVAPATAKAKAPAAKKPVAKAIEAAKTDEAATA